MVGKGESLWWVEGEGYGWKKGECFVWGKGVAKGGLWMVKMERVMGKNRGRVKDGKREGLCVGKR